MKYAQPERRRLRIVTNVQSTPTKLQHLAASRPFTRQVDVVFPSSDALHAMLSKLETRYYVAKVCLSGVTEDAFVDGAFAPEKCGTMLSIADHDNDDVWCADPRRLLTLGVGKETYQRLGLVGQKLPFKHREEHYVIRVPLQRGVESVANRRRRDEALRGWDGRRGRKWRVLYASSDGSPPNLQAEVRIVSCQSSTLSNIRIPSPSLSLCPSESAEDADDWNEDMVALFEWVGMAGLHSQRLKAYDKVDPYVALYECPSPSYVGAFTHLQWKGFIHPVFLQAIIDTALENLEAEPTGKHFFAITSHAVPASPVSYIPQSVKSANTPSDGPVRLPREEGEDVWSLVVTPSSGFQGVDWVMAESLGQYDTRWG